ncbi:MAG: TIGR00730 family Rossman fold protein [Bacteroidetes bacterium]|nr:TIGR00730 family Rossman fold protein [Bacteroidota bacterium]
MKTICIFCGSSFGNDAIYREKAEALGKLLALENITLVYGGSNLGLMGVIADSALTNNGKVIGIIPEHLESKGISHKRLTNLHIAKTMNERKAMMIDISDAFIALPGGYGTMDEITEVLSLNQLGIINKPCGLFNVKGFFNDYLKLHDIMVKEKFLRKEHSNMLIVDEDEKSLIKKIKNYKNVEIGKWF